MNNRRNPVLLVHGFGDRQDVFRRLKSYLVTRGWSVYSLNLSPNNGRKSLIELAQQLHYFVAQTFGETHTFDLVGFSMGGLVTRYYLQRLGGIQQVERYVNISTPNQGTLTAFSLPFAGIKEMRPNSDFLRSLNEDVARSLEATQVTWLWTPYDLMIVPATNSYLPIGREIKLPVLLHPWMLSHPKALKAIANALQT